jgi:spermidine synthase
VCYALSGAAALIYQVVWTRAFALELGHTVAASSTVLAAFMGGLGAGAWLTAWLPRFRVHRLRVYAAFELGVAVAALALPTLLAAIAPLLVWAYADGGAPARFVAVRLAVALILLGVPASLMGATFPVAAGWLADARDRQRSPAATAVAAVYAANAAGAAAGAITAGFWLVPAFGVRATTWCGVALNVVAASIAWRVAGHGDEVAERVQDDAAATGRERPRQALTVIAPRWSRPVAGIAAAVSGAAGLVYEVSWTRLLALVIGPTTYAFAAMAAAFIAGIAFGSSLCGRWSARVTNPALWLAATLAATGLCATTSSWYVASRVPLIVAGQIASGAAGTTVFVRESIVVLLAILPIGIALGATFTLAVATAATSPIDPQRESGRVYVANTIGAVLGALLAGFVLIERVGLQAAIVGTSRVIAIAAIAIAAAVLLPRRRAVGRTVVTAVGLAAIALAGLGRVPQWDRVLLSSGAYKYAKALGPDELEARLRAGTLDYYREGAASTVSVRQFGGTRSLSIDGKVDASNGADMLTQRLLGMLPVLLHPRPERALVIGLGSGVTAASVLLTGSVQHVDVVELSPEVVEASSFFRAENRGVLASPRLRLIVGDGRSHLKLTTGQYDVIVSEPSNPWMAGVAALFTREFFAAARARLRPGGVLCQWAHTYDMSRADIASIVATFASVFPQGTMWLVGESDLLLIGTAGVDIEGRIASLPDRVNAASLAAEWSVLGMRSSSSFVLLSQLVGGPAALAAVGAGAPLQLDDRMALEYSAPRSMYAASPIDNDAWLLDLSRRQAVPPVVTDTMRAARAPDWIARGRTALQADAAATAYESFRRAVALDPRSADGLRGATDAATQAHRVEELRSWLTMLATEDRTNTAVRIELAHVRAAAGDTRGAIDAALEALTIDSANPLALEQLASIYEDTSDGERLAAVADELTSRFADRVNGWYYRAASLLILGRRDEAIAAARRVVATDPAHGRAHNLLGIACAASGQMACAREAFETSRRLMPRDPSPYVNLGIFALQQADVPAATAYFADALALDTGSAAARQGLAQARAAAGGLR